jgi:hypothetical protein
MIEPIDLSGLQNLSLESGIANTANDSGGSGGSTGSLNDDLLDPIQQNYNPTGTFLDNAVWKDGIFGTRLRPYIDLQLFPHANAVRLPVALYDNDIYADKGLFYEDIEVKGNVEIKGQLSGSLNIEESISYSKSVETISFNKTIDASDRSKIFHVEPDGASVTIFLPSTGIEDGFFIEVVNALEGKFTTLSPSVGQLKAKGTGLSQAYSAATVYRHNSSWYAIGDLTS